MTRAPVPFRPPSRRWRELRAVRARGGSRIGAWLGPALGSAAAHGAAFAILGVGIGVGLVLPAPTSEREAPVLDAARTVILPAADPVEWTPPEAVEIATPEPRLVPAPWEPAESSADEWQPASPPARDSDPTRRLFSRPEPPGSATAPAPVLAAAATLRPAEAPAPVPALAEAAPVVTVTDARVSDDPSCQPAPDYPRSARRRQLSGTVRMRVRVSPAGSALAVTVEDSSGHAVLDEAATEAVRRWCFEPARRGGVPITGTARVSVEFRLDA